MTAAVPAPGPDPTDLAALLDLLQRGELEVHGRIMGASNATLLASASLDGVSTACVYKPQAGERPLWDFPGGTLAQREVAAFRLSEATGWHVVPPTVLRDGPFGTGSVQAWVYAGDPDDPVSAPEEVELPEPGAGLVDVMPAEQVPPGWLSVLDAHSERGARVVLAHADDPALRRMALFDAIANNADRKGGHVLADRWGSVYGIDNGLTFNVDEKLRTVLWGWAGQRLDPDSQEVLGRLAADLQDRGRLRRELRELLSAEEIDRTAARVRALVGSGRFPRPRAGRPVIPWPAF